VCDKESVYLCAFVCVCGWVRQDRFRTPIVDLCACVYVCGCVCAGERKRTQSGAHARVSGGK